ncbi:MAG: M13 family metallopeptidase, partial [Spirochaetales bacterium]|nr:M13 family metallopeptidase [Spirochaetales bacterium]
SSKTSGKLQGKPWVNSNIYDNWPSEKPALEEHYELHVNYDSYMKAKANGLTQDNLYSRSDDAQEAQLKALIYDTTKTSDELELIRAYYRLFSDFDKRNADGNKPLVLYRDMITNCTNIKELSAEVQKGLIFGNPFAIIYVDKAANDPSRYGVTIDYHLPISSLLEKDYTPEDKEEVKEYLAYLLELADYDADYAKHIIDVLEEYEANAAFLDAEFMEKTSNEDDVLIMTLDQIKDFCEPLYDLLIGLGYYSEDGSPVCYTVNNAGMFYAFDQMYLDDNLDILKAIYVTSMVGYAKTFIDMDTYVQFIDLEEGEQIEIDDVTYEFVNKYLSGAVDQVYLEFEFPEGLRDKIIDLTKKYISAMEKRLENESWLSAATKKKALEKIRNMVYVVVYPDEWLDYSDLLELVQDHDQFLLDAVLCCDDFYRNYKNSFLGKKIDRGNWVFTNRKTTEANAYYVSTENSINILAGILDDTLYFDNSIETVLASIGATIGHEITHGFDTDGALYNEFGDLENWWTEEDAKNFADRANRIADAMSEIYLTNDYATDGHHVLDEMVADIGGLILSLDIAKDYPNFDYDLFFRTYALMWYSIFPDVEYVLEKYERDIHPADFIRTNFVIQMFEEFYDTYPQVKEGTAMYRPKEERLSVW